MIVHDFLCDLHGPFEVWFNSADEFTGDTHTEDCKCGRPCHRVILSSSSISTDTQKHIYGATRTDLGYVSSWKEYEQKMEQKGLRVSDAPWREAIAIKKRQDEIHNEAMKKIHAINERVVYQKLGNRPDLK